MTQLYPLLSGEKRRELARAAAKATQDLWREAHKLVALPPITRAHAMAFILFPLFFLFPSGAGAQELPGAAMVFSTQEGATSQLPLIHEHLNVAIDQGHASTKFSHTFQNETKNNLEGRYQINLGTIATATGFAYFNGEEKIVGEIFEKEAAQRVYENITGQGRDPGLLEQVGEGAFSFRVAPIVPGEKKKVLLSTSAWLKQQGSTIEYMAPLALDGKGSRIAIEDNRAIKKIWSPSHDISIKRNTKGASVVVLQQKTQDKGRLILRYEVIEKEFELSSALHLSAGHDGYLVVSLAAPLDLQGQSEPRDVTLVIDHSGSMTGAPLKAARRATQGVIARLRQGDRVNVIAFDDNIELLFSTPQDISKIRKEAVAFVDGIQANGGTDLALALKQAISHQNEDGRTQVVLFLTDGQSNSVDALEAARNAGPQMRLYTVGIGSGVDRPLLSRLAREHHGRFTYVADEANLQSDVDRLFSRIQSPVLSNIELELDGARMSQMYPRQAPDLFRKDQLKFAARIHPTSQKGNVQLKLRAKGRSGPLTISKTLKLQPSSRPWVGRMWATQRVDDLLEQMSLTGEKPELKNEVIELALAYDLVTRYTSFLAIPESEITDAVRGTMSEERERRKRVLLKHKDAAALSRTLMPPGDPLLTVRAPREAQGVVAVFPFGLSLDLHYSQQSEMWEGRFLVPHHVADGNYQIEIIVVDRSGEVSRTSTSYEIDAHAPAFEVSVTDEGQAQRMVVEGDEPLREVRAQLADPEAGSLIVNGRSCPSDGCNLRAITKGLSQPVERFEGIFGLPIGKHRIRIVVTDEARNESVRIITIEVPETEEGC